MQGHPDAALVLVSGSGPVHSRIGRQPGLSQTFALVGGPDFDGLVAARSGQQSQSQPPFASSWAFLNWTPGQRLDVVLVAPQLVHNP